MQLQHRAYNPDRDDFKKLCAFIIEDNGRKKENFTWQLGRIVDWKYGLHFWPKYFPKFYRENAHLWVNYFDEVIAFAIAENGNEQFHLLAKEGYELLYSDMIAWVKENWLGREGKLWTNLAPNQDIQKQALLDAGFSEIGLSEISYQYDLSAIDYESIILPSGYRVESMKENHDPKGKAAVQLNAFQNKKEIEALDLAIREHIRESPIYTPEFDLSIVTSDGIHVASCEAFVDYENGIAEVERVCTHSDYRRMGLSRAVILSCFQRLLNHGIKTGYITGWNEATFKHYGGIPHTKAVKRIGYEFKSES